jgi:hypothetical protein
MGGLLLALSNELMGFNYRECFVGPFDVSNKVGPEAYDNDASKFAIWGPFALQGQAAALEQSDPRARGGALPVAACAGATLRSSCASEPGACRPLCSRTPYCRPAGGIRLAACIEASGTCPGTSSHARHSPCRVSDTPQTLYHVAQVVEMLMQREGTDVCCTSDSDATRAARFEAGSDRQA